MILVHPTEKKAIKGHYSAMTSSVKHHLHFAHTLDRVKEPSFFSQTPLDPFSIPQHPSMLNIKDVPFLDLPKKKENDHPPGSFEHGLHRMPATLEEGIDAMQSNKASTQGQSQATTKSTILIQAAQSRLTGLVSRINSPSNQMQKSLPLNAITNCFGRIHDSITKLESNALASSGYQTTLSFTLSSPPRDELERFFMGTGHRAKHRAVCLGGM